MVGRLDDERRRLGEMFAEVVWRVGEQVYGAKLWRGCVGEAANYAWVKGLSSMTREELAQGCDAMLTRWPKFPPTLPAFLEACRAHVTANAEQRALYGRVEGAERALPTLDELWEGSKVGRQWLAFMAAEGLVRWRSQTHSAGAVLEMLGVDAAKRVQMRRALEREQRALCERLGVSWEVRFGETARTAKAGATGDRDGCSARGVGAVGEDAQPAPAPGCEDVVARDA